MAWCWFKLDDELRQIRNDAIHSAVDAFAVDDPGRRWTIREIAEFAAIGGIGPVIVGGPGGSATSCSPGSRTPGSTASTSSTR
jgi:hypothetical protein